MVNGCLCLVEPMISVWQANLHSWAYELHIRSSISDYNSPKWQIVKMEGNALHFSIILFILYLFCLKFGI